METKKEEALPKEYQALVNTVKQQAETIAQLQLNNNILQLELSELQNKEVKTNE